MTDVTSVTETNRATVAAFYEAGIRGDLEALLAMMHDDVVVHEPSFLPYGGDYVGKGAFVDMFSVVVKYLDVSGLKVQYLVADGDRVLGIIRIPDLNTGQETLLAEESTLRDGKIASVRVFYFDAQSMIRQALGQ
ncbi:nuclear transport factor 2 family protein [Sporichthya polymorpha]|uniref:nuclear transport factor 2 family protein n=1 Tax=Sporichthya polymorpha TaxID=35751 RepID=UPI00037C84B0|nr:nuclear transport factor 2 family protein [Sporichthya polymorpha]